MGKEPSGGGGGLEFTKAVSEGGSANICLNVKWVFKNIFDQNSLRMPKIMAFEGIWTAGQYGQP